MPQFASDILRFRQTRTDACGSRSSACHATADATAGSKRRKKLSRHVSAAGLTLLELLLVIAILGLVVGLAIPSSEPSIHDQLRSAASILASDLDYARALAVANSSSYRITFDIPNNRYSLTHTGSNPSLNKLPRSPFSGVDASDDTLIVDLDELPLLGTGVRLVSVLSAGGVSQPVDHVEFGPLGQTTHSNAVTIWLAAGANKSTRYIWLEVNPATGLVTVGQQTALGPALPVQPVGNLATGTSSLLLGITELDQAR